MTAELCKKIDRETRARQNASKRCDCFAAGYPECGCEKFSIGENSPGIVLDNELLIRFHFTPRDFGDDNKPTPLAFQDVAALGLSVVRDGATNELMCSAIINRLVLMEIGSNWHSISGIKVEDVRKIFREQKGIAPERAFCVYDTAEIENSMHAEICGTKASRKLRATLREKFLPVSKEKFRDGTVEAEFNRIFCPLPKNGLTGT